MSTTPGTPNFPSKATSASIPAETLSKWTDTAAMILSNPLGPEAAAALTSLGDHLSANGWTEAAHTWSVRSSASTRQPTRISHILPATCCLRNPLLWAGSQILRLGLSSQAPRIPPPTLLFIWTKMLLSSRKSSSMLCPSTPRRDMKLSQDCRICSLIGCFVPCRSLKLGILQRPRGA